MGYLLLFGLIGLIFLGQWLHYKWLVHQDIKKFWVSHNARMERQEKEFKKRREENLRIWNRIGNRKLKG